MSPRLQAHILVDFNNHKQCATLLSNLYYRFLISRVSQ